MKFVWWVLFAPFPPMFAVLGWAQWYERRWLGPTIYWRQVRQVRVVLWFLSSFPIAYVWGWR